MFKKSKQAQGISLTVIVVAVIALIVLVVLLVIFSGKIGLFGKESASCASKGAGAKCEAECLEGYVIIPGADCAKQDPNKPVCCLPVNP